MLAVTRKHQGTSAPDPVAFTPICASCGLWAAEGYAEGTGVAMQIAGYGVPIRSVLAPWVALF
jgi:hypothetical protein